MLNTRAKYEHCLENILSFNSFYCSRYKVVFSRFDRLKFHHEKIALFLTLYKVTNDLCLQSFPIPFINIICTCEAQNYRHFIFPNEKKTIDTVSYADLICHIQLNESLKRNRFASNISQTLSKITR